MNERSQEPPGSPPQRPDPESQATKFQDMTEAEFARFVSDALRVFAWMTGAPIEHLATYAEAQLAMPCHGLVIQIGKATFVVNLLKHP